MAIPNRGGSIGSSSGISTSGSGDPFRVRQIPAIAMVPGQTTKKISLADYISGITGTVSVILENMPPSWSTLHADSTDSTVASPSVTQNGELRISPPANIDVTGKRFETFHFTLKATHTVGSLIQSPSITVYVYIFPPTAPTDIIAEFRPNSPFTAGELYTRYTIALNSFITGDFTSITLPADVANKFNFWFATDGSFSGLTRTFTKGSTTHLVIDALDDSEPDDIFSLDRAVISIVNGVVTTMGNIYIYVYPQPEEELGALVVGPVHVGMPENTSRDWSLPITVGGSLPTDLTGLSVTPTLVGKDDRLASAVFSVVDTNQLRVDVGIITFDALEFESVWATGRLHVERGDERYITSIDVDVQPQFFPYPSVSHTVGSNGDNATITISWNIGVTGFTRSDIEVTGATRITAGETGAFSGSGTTYTETINFLANSIGQATYTINANSAVYTRPSDTMDSEINIRELEKMGPRNDITHSIPYDTKDDVVIKPEFLWLPIEDMTVEEGSDISNIDLLDHLIIVNDNSVEYAITVGSNQLGITITDNTLAFGSTGPDITSEASYSITLTATEIADREADSENTAYTNQGIVAKQASFNVIVTPSESEPPVIVVGPVHVGMPENSEREWLLPISLDGTSITDTTTIPDNITITVAEVSQDSRLAASSTVSRNGNKINVNVGEITFPAGEFESVWLSGRLQVERESTNERYITQIAVDITPMAFPEPIISIVNNYDDANDRFSSATVGVKWNTNVSGFTTDDITVSSDITETIANITSGTVGSLVSTNASSYNQLITFPVPKRGQATYTIAANAATATRSASGDLESGMLRELTKMGPRNAVTQSIPYNTTYLLDVLEWSIPDTITENTSPNPMVTLTFNAAATSAGILEAIGHLFANFLGTPMPTSGTANNSTGWNIPITVPENSQGYFSIRVAQNSVTGVEGAESSFEVTGPLFHRYSPSITFDTRTGTTPEFKWIPLDDIEIEEGASIDDIEDLDDYLIILNKGEMDIEYALTVGSNQLGARVSGTTLSFTSTGPDITSDAIYTITLTATEIADREADAGNMITAYTNQGVASKSSSFAVTVTPSEEELGALVVGPVHVGMPENTSRDWSLPITVGGSLPTDLTGLSVTPTLVGKDDRLASAVFSVADTNQLRVDVGSITFTGTEFESVWASGRLHVERAATDERYITQIAVDIVPQTFPEPEISHVDNNDGTATVTITWNLIVTGFGRADVEVTGATRITAGETGAFSGSGTTYTETINFLANSIGQATYTVNTDTGTYTRSSDTTNADINIRSLDKTGPRNDITHSIPYDTKLVVVSNADVKDISIRLAVGEIRAISLDNYISGNVNTNGVSVNWDDIDTSDTESTIPNWIAESGNGVNKTLTISPTSTNFTHKTGNTGGAFDTFSRYRFVITATGAGDGNSDTGTLYIYIDKTPETQDPSAGDYIVWDIPEGSQLFDNMQGTFDITAEFYRDMAVQNVTWSTDPMSIEGIDGGMIGWKSTSANGSSTRILTVTVPADKMGTVFVVIPINLGDTDTSTTELDYPKTAIRSPGIPVDTRAQGIYIKEVYIPEGQLTGQFYIYVTFNQSVEKRDNADIDDTVFDLEGVDGASIDSVILVSTTSITIQDQIDDAIAITEFSNLSDIPENTYRLSITVPANTELSLLNLYLLDGKVQSVTP